MRASSAVRFRRGMEKPPRSARRDGSGRMILIDGLVDPGACAEDDDQQDKQDERECSRADTAAVAGSTNWIAHL
ncbi:hypothetical protein J19TS2_46650 [Cohnella xylanilytica]|nr:hypothetical protein J19TS2_46650 [Cohnella xylanilytica]